ncbi:MAG: type efflux pump, partial [Moraxellaceae bacterium]|nr:type efflux pump [Moraxellaceae bacterium]
NNGQVDIIAAPVLLFEHLELARGLERGGGIYRFPLGQLTSTLLVRRERFLAGFAERLRARAPGFVTTALQRIRTTEASLPAHYWLGLDARELAHYAELLAAARDQLTREGFYDPRMMAILQRLRCRQSPGNAECAPAQRG